APHYVLPCLAFAGILNGFLVVTLSSDSLRTWVRKTLAIAGAVLLILSVNRTLAYTATRTTEMRHAAAEIGALANKRAALGDCVVIGYYRSSVPSYALEFGNGYSHVIHGAALEELYPNTITYHYWLNRFLSFTH